MYTPATHLLRNTAATLVTLSGLSMLGALWFRDLGAEALMDALVGAVYLFVGIGLCGRSRFTLFVAIAVSAAGIALVSGRGDSPDALHQLRMLADLTVILCCAGVLWRIRPGSRT